VRRRGTIAWRRGSTSPPLMHGEFPWWWSSSLRWRYSTAEIEVDLAPPLRGGERAPAVVKMLCVGDVFWEKIRMRRDVCLRWKYECSYIVERGRWRRLQHRRCDQAGRWFRSVWRSIYEATP
jgi:hypothetical protein